MLTHLIKSINWLDVGLLCLFLRVIFIGVKNGFITEFFKFLGMVLAVFISLHYYSGLAAWALKTTSIEIGCWGLIAFAGLWFGVVVIFKFIRDGIFVLFKIETNHEGFNQYAAGILACLRGLLICSMVLFLILLVNSVPTTRMALRSYSFRVAGRLAVNTYSVLFNSLVDKLWVGQQYNSAGAQVVRQRS